MAISYNASLVKCSIQKKPSYVSDNPRHYNIPFFSHFKVSTYLSMAHIFILFVFFSHFAFK